MSLDNFHPRMCDDLTDAITLILRAQSCLQAISVSKDALSRIQTTLLGNESKLALSSSPNEIIGTADAVIRIICTKAAELETVRATIDELLRTLEGESKRRFADRLQERNLILYGISVS